MHVLYTGDGIWHIALANGTQLTLQPGINVMHPIDWERALMNKAFSDAYANDTILLVKEIPLWDQLKNKANQIKDDAVSYWQKLIDKITG